MTELIIALGQKSLYIGDNTRSKLSKSLLFYREVYFPTVEALLVLAQKVDRVVFLLWDTATLAPVLKAYLSNQGVNNVCFETIRTSSIDNVEEVQAQVLSLCLSSTFLNVQDAPLSIVNAITKRIKESEWIWQTTVTSREIGTMLERSGKGNAITKTIKEADWFWQTSKTSQDLEKMLEKSVKGAEYIWLLDHRNAVLGRPITPSIN